MVLEAAARQTGSWVILAYTSKNVGKQQRAYGFVDSARQICVKLFCAVKRYFRKSERITTKPRTPGHFQVGPNWFSRRSGIHETQAHIKAMNTRASMLKKSHNMQNRTHL